MTYMVQLPVKSHMYCNLSSHTYTVIYQDTQGWLLIFVSRLVSNLKKNSRNVCRRAQSVLITFAWVLVDHSTMWIPTKSRLLVSMTIRFMSPSRPWYNVNTYEGAVCWTLWQLDSWVLVDHGTMWIPTRSRLLESMTIAFVSPSRPWYNVNTYQEQCVGLYDNRIHES
jgi:hypothetical protein